MRIFFCFSCLLLFIANFLTACGSPEAPLDANTRQLIDSISAAQIRMTRIHLDSLCQVHRTTKMPILIDSIRKVRMQEIEEKMKSIPH